MDNKLIDFITKLEGYVREPYDDGAGYLTIGVGHKLTESELSSGKILIGKEYIRYQDGLNDEQINKLLIQDLSRYKKIVESYVNIQISENQKIALISFCFNVGITAFINSTLLRMLNKGIFQQVPNQLKRWVYSGGKKFNGLEVRRNREIELFNSQEERLA